MIATRLLQMTDGLAPLTLLLRAGLVGGNFAVMLGLAWWLGLSVFGELMMLWAQAMVAATLLSLGAPLLILRTMVDVHGMRPEGLLRQGVMYPAALGACALIVMPALWPGLDWWAVIPAGLAINAVTCLASVMRALGSVRMSMALRDAAPQLALGVAACLASAQADAILSGAAVVLALLATLLLVWVMTHPQLGTCLCADGDAGTIRPGLWGTAVLGMLTAQLDIILGGSFMRSEQIGIYALLRRIANLVALPVSVASWVSAGPIAAAFRAGDRTGLSRASAAGSQIALVPGALLFLGALIALPFWPGLEGAHWLALILLCGALIQVGLASGFTVATLCGFEHYALLARLVGVTAYLLCAGMLTSTATGNALAYVAGVGAGGALLWWLLWRRLQIDTSAMVFWRGERRQAWRLP